MGAIIEIWISDEPTSEIVHRFRNFGEEVRRALSDTCSMSIGQHRPDRLCHHEFPDSRHSTF